MVNNLNIIYERLKYIYVFNFLMTFSVPPSGASKSWQLPDRAPSSSNASRFAKLDGRRVLGEVLYLLEPVVHLAARARFGERSWKPFSISLACDLARYTYTAQRYNYV